MTEFTGVCRYCGQHKLVEIPDAATEEEINEEATVMCRCLPAQAYRDELAHKERVEAAICSAEGTTYELFNDEYPDIEQLLNSAMRPLAAGTIKKVTINTNGKTKASISFAADTFKVEREDKKSIKRQTEI